MIFLCVCGVSDVGGDVMCVAFETRDARGLFVEAFVAVSCGGVVGVVIWFIVFLLDNVKIIY